MGGWSSNLSAGFISFPVQPTGVFAGQTYYNSTSGIAYVFNGTTWNMMSGTIGGLIYQGTWNATTNTPTLGNGGAGGVKGDYYVVSVAGTTSIDGVNDWEVGDWIVNNGTIWQKVDNSELPTIYTGDGTVGTNRQLTLTDKIVTNSLIGTMTTLSGVGVDPIGFGYDGVLSYMYDNPSAVEGWGGLVNISGNPAWLQEIYIQSGDSAGIFVGYSALQTNPYSSIYHFENTGGTYRGFEANAFGEQLYSQRLGLVVTALTSADRILFVSAAGGYLKATTYANLVTQLAIPTFYNQNGSTVGARTVTLGGTLQFNHGAAGVNGYVQMASGGYFRNQTSIGTNYFEYNNVNGVFLLNSDTHTVTGFRANNDAGVNPTALVEMFAGSTGNAYINIGANTGRLDFYTNNTAVFAGTLHASGKWSFGGLTGNIARATFNGTGNTDATANTIWNNLSGIELARVTDNGGLCIGINTLTGGFANASKLRIGDTVSTDYTSSFLIDQTYAQTANNTNTSTAIYARLYKSSAFNTLEMKASGFLARNDGAGSINLMYGNESMVWGIGAATIQAAFAYSARVQFQAGTYTLIGGIDISFQESLAGNVGSMIGVFIRTPVNVTAPTITNTYGIYIQGNSIGANNYGIVSNSQNSNGFGTDTPNAKAILELRSTTKGFMPPSMTTVERDAIVAPPASLMIYNNTTNKLNFYNGGAWEQVTSA